ncbi:SO_0444 family Cu/Zn efflux transporter [Alkalilimnicola ehrlichii MLHE-1]|uniref:Permease n=1 Tax=Alkalilimnicola ehrlichii (strain ATCC BAA-1101 / DSM 17681 / MLHE-1) TaxID=187272 RepID=Q0A596_ALKEH|nr:SO_0444 family Cu/Zn efflux transporter [Alkalilimnicola ehrlichii]ABI57991.1 permease [Alkalilimnicola ehrlichii MLHE-1]
MIDTLLQNTLAITLAAAPWLLLGLLVAGAVRALIPEDQLQTWLGGSGIAPITRAALVGAPLPLCSCGAIPTAVALHRGGASRGASTAFLIGTPGVGVDSVILTWALLGPFMAVVRPLGAVSTAIATGLAVGRLPLPRQGGQAVKDAAECGSCCGESCAGGAGAEAAAGTPSFGGRLARGLRYAVTDLLDDIGLWLLGGLLLAGMLITWIPAGALAEWGSGLPAMLALAAAGIPLYLCATAVTPVAAGLILAGVSPGTALVLLLAGPITSLATLAVLRREMGMTVVSIYLASILLCAVSAGLLVDGVVAALEVDVAAQSTAAVEWMPDGLKWLALIVLVTLGIRPLRRRLPGLALD